MIDQRISSREFMDQIRSFQVGHVSIAIRTLGQMRRVGNVTDVSAAVAFLASSQASFISGQTLYVDGGLFTQGSWPYEVSRAQIE